MEETLPAVVGAPYADYAVPGLASLAEIAERGAEEFGEAAAFERSDGHVTTYARLAELVCEVRLRLRASARGRVVPVRDADPERVAVTALAAWAEGLAVALGPAVCAELDERPELAADGMLEGAACVLASSGTTSDPKLVVLTHAGVLADLLAGLARYAFVPGARYVSLLPTSHAFGLVCDLLAPLATGGTICVPTAPTAFLAELPRFAPSALNVPPQVASVLLHAMRVRADAGEASGDVRRAVCGEALRKLMCGGAGLSAGASEGLRAFGIEAYGCYGLSECSPCVSINRERHRRDGSAGLPLGVNDVHVAADGEILVRGVNVMAGYLGRPDLTARVIRDGWLHTGDVGELDADGFLWVRGRKDALVALADGTLVSPEVWERALGEVPGVRQALVRGEDGLLVARVCVDSRARTADVERACRVVSPDGTHLLARVDVTTDSLPATALGKTRRRA